MSILIQLGGLALRGAAQAAGELAGFRAAGAGAEALVGFLQQRFTDHSQRLTQALHRASTRAWRAAELALAGRSWWQRCQLTLASADDRALRAAVEAYLEVHPLDGIDGHGPDFRGQCLAQLQAARKAGLLDSGPVDPAELARRQADLSRFGDPAGLLAAELRTLDEIAVRLRQAGYDALAAFVTLRPGSGPPLLSSAVRFFFQQEVERDPQLFSGLAYARLEELSEGQRAGFGGLAEVLDRHGARLEGLLVEVQAVVTQTHAQVLDIRAELSRQGQQMQELGRAVLNALSQHQLDRRELQTSDSLSIRDEEERRVVRDLVRRYRSLPVEQRRQMPALLNAVGKLEVVAGDFASAQKDFQELVQMLPTPTERAEAAHNAYRAGLEQHAFAEAFSSFLEAVSLDPDRFAPFPISKFEPERILGAGGFGVAFLCRNRHSGGRVVLKALRRDGLDRDLGEVFREAQALEDLEHPAIIRIRDCDYADPERTRPYLVMDYFAGLTLSEHVQRHGVLSPAQLLPLARLVASGLERAHARGILHRDVKPHNLLVRPIENAKEKHAWDVRLIDFGLALRAQGRASTRRSSLDGTLAGSSIAGTLEYAAPEQLGRLRGVAVGTYSDVYGFGKTCCFALFGTPQPTFQHWQKIPPALADLLGRCLAEAPNERPGDFAEVRREMELLDRPRSAGSAETRPPARPVPVVPKRTVEPVLDAEPIEDVLPVRRPARPRRVRPDPEEEESRPRPTRRGGSGGLVVGLSVGACLLGAGILLFLSRRTDEVPASFTSGNQGLAGLGKFLVGTTRPASPSSIEPISEKEFPPVLEELKKGPAMVRREELGRRLAATEPTPAQKQRHARTRELADLERRGAAPARERKEAEAQDDILQVSRALEPLLAATDFKVKMVGAQAMSRWGTEENVPALIRLLEAGEEGGVIDFRIAVARALGAIGDPRGIDPVANRLTSQWDRGRGIVPALIAFGPAAEDAVLRHARDSDHWTARPACEVLGEIGTRKSLPVLRELASNPRTFFTVKRAAEEAARKVEARLPRKPSS